MCLVSWLYYSPIHRCPLMKGSEVVMGSTHLVKKLVSLGLLG